MKLFPTVATTKSVYFWNMMGSFSNAFLSVFVLMIITRLMNPLDADIFNIAWAICQLMATIGTFQVRMYQATDVEGEFSFKQYFQFRLLCFSLMMISSFIYVVYLKFDVYKSFIILLLCLYKAIECFTDVYEGWFQQRERLDISGKASFLRVVISLIVILFMAFCTGNLTLVCLGLVISYALCFYFFNVRVYHEFEEFKDIVSSKTGSNWMFRIVKETLPLFVNSFLAMSIINMPKVSIDLAMENGILSTGTQTIYGVIFMPASFLTLFYIVFRPLITRMAIYWDEKKIADFSKVLRQIMLILLVFSVVIIMVAYFIGCPVLSLFYGIDLNSYSMELVIILIGGCLYTFACIIDNALVVIRKQYVLFFSYLFTWIVSNLIVNNLVELYGILGGAISYAISTFCFFVSMAILFCVEYNREKRVMLNKREDAA